MRNHICRIVLSERSSFFGFFKLFYIPWKDIYGRSRMLEWVVGVDYFYGGKRDDYWARKKI